MDRERRGPQIFLSACGRASRIGIPVSDLTWNPGDRVLVPGLTTDSDQGENLHIKQSIATDLATQGEIINQQPHQLRIEFLASSGRKRRSQTESYNRVLCPYVTVFLSVAYALTWLLYPQLLP
jgi:hypothetical protein